MTKLTKLTLAAALAISVAGTASAENNIAGRSRRGLRLNRGGHAAVEQIRCYGRQYYREGKHRADADTLAPEAFG